MTSFRSNDSGAAAVEFAIIMPLFILIMMGVVVFGSILSIHNGIQQIAAEAARASVAGLSSTERDALARAVITTSTPAYPFLEAARITVSTATADTTFKVSVTYDLSGAPAFQFARFLPLPAPVVTRSAVVQIGGF